VWALADDLEPEGELLEPQVLIEQSSRRFGAPTFLDDRHLAVPSTALAEQPEHRVYLLDRTRPGVYLSLPVEFFAEGRSLREVFALAPASEAAGPELLVNAQQDGRVELIRVRVAVEAWRSFVAEQPGEHELGVEGRMVSLVPEQLEAELLFDAASVLGIGAGSGAVIVSSADGPMPAELTWIDLATGDRRRLTDTRVRDYLPRIGAEGFATFVSLMRIDLSATPFSVPRVLPLQR